MKKTVFTLLAGLALLCSCEKIDSHYTYEETVPGTTIKESQLGKALTHQEFLYATSEAYFVHQGSYPCIRNNGKVYYSNEMDETPMYGGMPLLTRRKFNRYYAECYEWVLGETDSLTLFYMDYSFEDDMLKGLVLGDIADSKEYRVLYADKDYLIFETEGKTNNNYNNEGSEFSRVVYKRATDELPQLPARLIDCRDVYASFSTVPATAVSEKSIADFKPITYNEYLTITSDKVYHKQGRYCCREKDGEVQYVPSVLPVDTSKGEEYNQLFEQIGGNINYYAFRDGYTERYYYGIDGHAKEIAGLDYSNYTFDEASQWLSCQYLEGNVAYADETCVILERPLPDYSAALLEDYMGLPKSYTKGNQFFERTVLILHTQELKEPTEINDNRK